MQRCVFGDLQIDVDDGPEAAIRLDWRGKSNHRQPDTVLSPFFDDVTKQAVAASKAVEMHFEALEFFNSSTISVIIQYVKDLRAAKVRLEVFYNPHHQWQKIFFDALSMFEKGDGLLKMRPVA